MVKPFKAGLLLSRAPIVTPRPSVFLSSYYKYMAELERRLMWTFPSYFYFKRGTLSQRRFNDLQKGPVPRHRGVFYPLGAPDIQHNRDRRFKQEVTIVPDEQEKVRIQPRNTESEDDRTSLARKLDKTLYLLIKQSTWSFPTFKVDDDASSLHVAAENGLRQLGGEFMNTWLVSNTPAAVVHPDSASAEPEFLLKSHILHGKFTPTDGATHFAWLTKEEIKELVNEEYYKQVCDLL